MYVTPSAPYTLVANIGTPGLTTVGVTIVKAIDGSEVEARSQVGVVETPAGSGIYSVTRPTAPADDATYIGVFDVDGDAPFVAVEFIVTADIPFPSELPEGLLTRIKERVETDISDDELVRMALEANAEIELRFGADGEQIDHYAAVVGGVASLSPSRPINADETVTAVFADTDDEELTGEELTLLHGGQTVQRADGGRFYGRVKLTYTPKLDTDQRDETIIKLVGLALEYRGGARYDSIGDVSNGYAIWSEERNLLLRELTPRKSLMML